MHADRVSSLQLAQQQPSHWSLLPLSHCLAGVAGARRRGEAREAVGLAGSAVQPSPATVPPSSHSSLPSSVPLPHEAISITQVALQPSPAVVLPSSHCSAPSTSSLPHTATTHEPHSSIAVSTQLASHATVQQSAFVSHTHALSCGSFEPGPACASQGSPQSTSHWLIATSTQVRSQASVQQKSSRPHTQTSTASSATPGVSCAAQATPSY